MSKKWYNFKDVKPKFVTLEEEVKISKEIMLLIDGQLHLGYLVSELLDTGWSTGLEIAVYSLNYLHYGHECIFEDDFDNYTIYWSELENTEDILRQIEEERINETKTEERNIAEGL